MDGQAAIRRADGLPFQSIDGRILVVVPKRKEVHQLNETASRVWMLLEEARTLDGLVGALAGEYDADPATIRRDLETSVDEMRRKGLIVTG